MSYLDDSILSLNAVAMGDKKADLILKNCSLVSVYTNEVIPKTQLAITQDRIAYVGQDASHTVGPKTKVVDLKEKYVTPGFVDPHIHIDQFILPSEQAKISLLGGTTSLFSDPIDIVSVAGYKGFKEFVRLTEDLPIRIFHVVPGGLPVDRKFSTGNSLTQSQELTALDNPNVLGLGEVFSWTKVITRDPSTMQSISSILANHYLVNGHTAGLSGKKLNAYISSGIFSCHEPINFDQALERLRLGMWIMIREGSIRRDIRNIIPKMLGHETHLERLMFCTDNLDPNEAEQFGHIDHCIREAIKHGVNPIDAITMASRNCFDYYNMSKELGGLAPGKLADILVFDDLESFKPRDVYVGGELVVSNQKLIAKILKKTPNPWLKKTVQLRKLNASDFVVPSKSKSVSVNTIKMLTEIITTFGTAQLDTKDGNVIPCMERDIWKVAAFDRIHGTNKGSMGFLENFGADIGAFASTWSLHENDLIVIGSNDSDMVIASNVLIKSGGGMVVVKDNKVLTLLPLQLGGIISSDPSHTVSSNLASINDCMSGSSFKKPYMIPLFLSLLSLPSVRIVHKGMIDIKKRSIIPAIRHK